MTYLIDLIKKNPTFMKISLLVTGAILVIWSLAAVDTSHAHTWMEKHIPAFWSFFGFTASVVIIFFSKWFGKSGIQIEGERDND